MPWSRITAGGSATTWGQETASDTTWTARVSVNSFNWIPYSQRTDLYKGVDFIPKATDVAPFKLDSTRPAVVWELSAITASSFTAEHRP